MNEWYLLEFTALLGATSKCSLWSHILRCFQFDMGDNTNLMKKIIILNLYFLNIKYGNVQGGWRRDIPMVSSHLFRFSKCKLCWLTQFKGKTPPTPVTTPPTIQANFCYIRKVKYLFKSVKLGIFIFAVKHILYLSLLANLVSIGVNHH